MRHVWDLKRQNKDVEIPHIPNKVQLIYSASTANELVFQVRYFYKILVCFDIFYEYRATTILTQLISCNGVFTLPDTETNTETDKKWIV